MDLTLARSLATWAGDSNERKQQLQDYMDEALVKIVAGKGKDVQSVTANGVSTTFSNDSLTVSEWFSTLTKALEIINNPLAGRKKAIQVFR
jgi:hypothetical protein